MKFAVLFKAVFLLVVVETNALYDPVGPDVVTYPQPNVTRHQKYPIGPGGINLSKYNSTKAKNQTRAPVFLITLSPLNGTTKGSPGFSVIPVENTFNATHLIQQGYRQIQSNGSEAIRTYQTVASDIILKLTQINPKFDIQNLIAAYWKNIEQTQQTYDIIIWPKYYQLLLNVTVPSEGPKVYQASITANRYMGQRINKLESLKQVRIIELIPPKLSKVEHITTVKPTTAKPTIPSVKVIVAKHAVKKILPAKV